MPAPTTIQLLTTLTHTPIKEVGRKLVGARLTALFAIHPDEFSVILKQTVTCSGVFVHIEEIVTFLRSTGYHAAAQWLRIQKTKIGEYLILRGDEIEIVDGSPAIPDLPAHVRTYYGLPAVQAAR
jgi:hypothetical protein